MALVSVIIPTYNRARFVVEAVESVLHQSFKDYEVIVVDDGSDDATPELLSPYINRIRYIAQPRQGPSAARNTGINESRGTYCAFLDSDDLWRPEKLERQVEFFATHPDFHICQTQELWLRNDREIKPRPKHRKEHGCFFERAVGLCLISPSAVMMRRTLFDAVGLFDEMLSAAEDYDLWLRVTARYPVGLIDEELVIKRGGHADQLSVKSIGILDRYRIQALINILESGWLSRKQVEVAMHELRRKCRIYASGCRKHGREAEADYYEKLPDIVKKRRGRG